VGFSTSGQYPKAPKVQCSGSHPPGQQLVEGGSTGQDDGLALDLHGTLTKTNQIGTNA